MKSTLRIGVDARPLSSPLTGIGRYTLELVSRIQTAPGCELFLYSDRPLLATPDAIDSMTVRHGQCSGSFVSTLFAQLVFPRWAKQDSIDLFWSPRHHLPLLLSAQLHQVVTIHDMVWKRYPRSMTRGGLWIERMLMPAALRRATKIIAVSESTSRDIQQFYPQLHGKVRCILSGHAGIPEPAGPTPGSAPYLLFVGTMEPRKNLATLLDAWSIWQQHGPVPSQLKIVGGDGWGKLNLAARINQLGLNDTVEILGRVDDSLLEGLYAGAHALAMPSLYEGFGLPLLEAMRYGVPAIAGNNSAMPEIVGDAGLLVDASCSADLAVAIGSIFKDSGLRDALSRKAFARARSFSWEKSAQQTLQVFWQAWESQVKGA